jgi:hypothetical protein
MVDVNARDLPSSFRRLLDGVAEGRGSVTIKGDGSRPVYVVSEQEEQQLVELVRPAERTMASSTPSHAVRRLIALAERAATNPATMENAAARGSRDWAREDLYPRK